MAKKKPTPPQQQAPKRNPLKTKPAEAPSAMLARMTEIADAVNLACLDKKMPDPVVFVPGKSHSEVEWIPSGVDSLDEQLSGTVGKGWPLGRVIEIFGPESSGKTTLASQALAAFQKAFPNQPAAFVDAEHAVDLPYMGRLGVDADRLLFSQPSYGEQALNAVLEFAKHKVSVIIVDSVAALVPKSEIEGDIGDSHIGLQARMMGQALRKLAHVLTQTRTTVIFTNQIRMKIGVMFGNPETQPGGNALRFYASLRLDVRCTERNAVKRNGEPAGNIVKIKTVKNKLYKPYLDKEYKLIFSEGFRDKK